MNFWLVMLIFVVDAIVISVIVGAFATGVWIPLVKKFPEQPIGTDSFRKNFQSISIGSVSFGFCVHMAADDLFLHWVPVQFLRIFGCKTISLPWSSIQPASKQPLFQKRLANIVLLEQKGQIITIPRWCLDVKTAMDIPDTGPPETNAGS